METENYLKSRRERVRHAVVLDGSRSATDATLRALADAGITRVVLVGGAVHSDLPLAIDSAEDFASAVASFPADADVLVCDPDCEGAVQWVFDLVSERRSDVVVVHPRLSHQIDRTRARFALEPVDVPWYARRVVGLSRELPTGDAHGEAMEFGIVSARSRSEAADAPDLFSMLSKAAASSRLYVHAVPGPRWSAATAVPVSV